MDLFRGVATVSRSLASQTLFPVLVGVAGSAAGKKGLVSLGHNYSVASAGM